MQFIKNDGRVFIHGGAATPEILINALTQRYAELRNVEIILLHTEGEAQILHMEQKH